MRGVLIRAKLTAQNQQKKRTKHALYLTRSNWTEDNKDSSDLHPQRYFYQFNSLAKDNDSLHDVFLTFSPCIYELPSDAQAKATKETPLNQFFMYLVELYHLHDQYLPESTKPTEAFVTMVNDTLGGKQDKILRDKVGSLINEIKMKEADLSRKVDRSNKKICEKIARVRILKQCLKQQYAISILAIKQPQIRQIYIPKHMQAVAQEHVHKTLTTLHDLQFSKKKYRYLKLQNFYQSYNKLWKTRYVEMDDEGRWAKRKGLFTTRYTNIKKTQNYYDFEVLITLRDLLSMKKEEPLDRQLGIEIMRQLGKALAYHRQITRNHYPLLHPKDIIINQIDLKVHLSHIPPILSALGLLKTPMTYEQMVAFAATPQTFDPFSAPLEHLDQNIQYGTGREIFYDIAYGLDSLLKDPKTGYNFPPMKFEGTDLTMRQVKQQYEKISEAWRFTMIGSYLLNGKEYHKQDATSTASYESFKAYLRREKDKYNENVVQYIQKVLNYELEVQEALEDNEFSLSIFNKFLEFKPQDSELQQPHRYYKYQQIIKKQASLQQNIVNDLAGQSFKFQLNNQKRYLILFYLSLFQSLFHIRTISEYAIEDFAKCREMADRFSKDIGINYKPDDVDAKSYIERSVVKFREYKEKVAKNEKKEKEVADALRYLDKNYALAYRSMEQQRNKYYELKKAFKEHLFSDHISEKQQIGKVFSKIISHVSLLMNEYRTYLLHIIQKQLSLPKDITNEALTKTDIQISSFHVKLNLFLTITRQNFLTLESLVLPLLNIKKKKDQQQAPFDESFEFHLYVLYLLKQHQSPPQTNPFQYNQSYPKLSQSEQIYLQQ